MLYRNSLNCKLQKFSTKALLQSSKDINSGSLPILLSHFISFTNLYIYIWRILKSFPLKKGSFIYKICIIHLWFTVHRESLFLTFAHLRRQIALYPVPSCLSLMYLFVRVAKSCRSITINWKPIVETRSSTQQKSGRNKISRLVNLAKLVKRRSIDSETMIEYAHSAMAQSNFPLWWQTFCSTSSSVLFPCPCVVRAGAIVDAAKHQIFSNRWKRILPVRALQLRGTYFFSCLQWLYTCIQFDNSKSSPQLESFTLDYFSLALCLLLYTKMINASEMIIQH